MTGLATALGRLLTDSNVRRAYGEGREQVAAQLDVDADVLPAFLSLNLSDLDEQARTLKSKRLSEAAGFMPTTMASLGKDRQSLFFCYAETYWPQGHRRHAIDALAFADHLHMQRDDRLCGLEHNRLRHHVRNRRLTMGLLKNYQAGRKRRTVLHVIVNWRRQPLERVFYLSLTD